MNELPIDWLFELSEAYPKRSGPYGWKGMRMLLCVRRALLESTWIEIMNGVKRYARFCQESGKEGTEYVLSPKAFFDDAIYLEELAYQAPQTKEEIERGRIRAADERRYVVAKEAAKRYGLTPSPGEPVGSFETRLELARQGISAEGRSPDSVGRSDNGVLRSRISDLANRMRAK